MTYHNLAPKARIIALGALLLLVQACGGGGGGGSSTVTCMGDTPLLHEGDCVAECPNAAPVADDNECRVARMMSECPADRPMRDTTSPGNCRPQMMGECMGDQTIVTGACTDPTCTGTTPILNSDRECQRADDDADCAPFTATPIAASDGSCRAVRTSTECMSVSPATPIFGTSGRCERADDDADCTSAHPATPIEDGGACREIETSAECNSVNTARPIFVSGGICRSSVSDAQCAMEHPTRPLSDNGTCRPPIDSAECRVLTPATPIFGAGNTCRPANDEADCAREHPTTAPRFVAGGTCRAEVVQRMMLDDTEVSFHEVVTPEQTRAYRRVFDAGRNTPINETSASQSENCGTTCDGSNPPVDG